jgi:hypothetical protein
MGATKVRGLSSQEGRGWSCKGGESHRALTPCATRQSTGKGARDWMLHEHKACPIIPGIVPAGLGSCPVAGFGLSACWGL